MPIIVLGVVLVAAFILVMYDAYRGSRRSPKPTGRDTGETRGDNPQGFDSPAPKKR